MFYTDGITEARDEEGAFFGRDRLADFLERQTAAGHAPPEMVRRLISSVIQHQRGNLQDDATILVAKWGDFSWGLRP